MKSRIFLLLVGFHILAGSVLGQTATACFHAAARRYANPFDTGFWHIDSHGKDAGRAGSGAAGKSTKV